MGADLALIKEAILELNEEEQFKVHTCAATLRKTVAEAGGAGMIAIALVGVEMSED